MSGGQTETTTQSSEPWGPAQPALRQGVNDALNLYRSGVGGAVNTMSNVTPFARQSVRAMNIGENIAGSNMGPSGLVGQNQRIINNGGFNAPQMEALSGIRSTANSSFNPFDNQGFGAVLRQARDSASNSVNSAASGMGRFGGGAHQGVLAKSVGDVTGQLMNNEYNNWQGRRDAAQQNLFNAGQQGQGNMTAAYQAMQAPLQTLSNIGSSYEDLHTRQINDRNRIFDARNNQAWDQIGRLNAAAGGVGSMGGTSSGTATGPGQNMFGQVAGGLLGLSGLFG